ncbi:hypothetical protein B5X24_HaOG207999 [Helicoverpa armigera]|uniref:Uncharacterized protein n=1 Tax=Helicoverpa armigera TaxID=29058 RepID=A0A2W1BM08_HELAM|nr:hypothetical protein B5X24_HaOG207999 [Helicoverpa armigera]
MMIDVGDKLVFIQRNLKYTLVSKTKIPYFKTTNSFIGVLCINFIFLSPYDFRLIVIGITFFCGSPSLFIICWGPRCFSLP